MSAETAANEKAGWWVAGIMGGGGEGEELGGRDLL